MRRLARIPADECGPRVWQALEAGTMARLAQAALDRDPVRGFNRCLEVWDSSDPPLLARRLGIPRVNSPNGWPRWPRPTHPSDSVSGSIGCV